MVNNMDIALDNHTVQEAKEKILIMVNMVDHRIKKNMVDHHIKENMADRHMENTVIIENYFEI
jgi:hypothetical protein